MIDVYGMPVHPAAELFPMLAGDELRDLAEDIRAHGLHEPLWVWDDPDRGPVLLDGRNRLAACKLAGVRPTTRAYAGDELDALEFVISWNVKRRHLTAGQKAAVAYESLPLFEAATAKREAERKRREIDAQRNKTGAGRHQSKNDGGQSSPARKRAPRSSDKAAKKSGASGRSTARYKRIAEQAPDLIEKIRGPEQMSLDRAERIIRDRIAEQRRIEQARREAAAQPEPTRVDIRHGDFRQTLADLENVDAIITDPPYAREFLPLLADLAVWADKVLTSDGVLAVLMGQTYLPEVYRLLDGGRPYRWTACYLTPGAGYRSHPRRLQSNWKPLLIYGGGPRFADVFRTEASDADAKNNHRWGQDYGAFHAIVETLTAHGQTVADPFMGSGTTLLAAHALGRHAVGCDIEAEHVVKAKERLA
jgi:ParB-like chromosome segregation protein Spo0J